MGRFSQPKVFQKTQKLINLDKDTGKDKPSGVSGIAEYFKSEEEVDRQVCLLVNLEPRKLGGIKSHGMILMAPCGLWRPTKRLVIGLR